MKKSIELQNLVFCEYHNGIGPNQIFRDLNGTVSLPTIKRWFKMINNHGCIALSKAIEHPRSARTKKNIQKVKRCLNQQKKVAIRPLAKEVGYQQKAWGKFQRMI